MKKIKTALISVYYKDGLDEIVKILASQGVVIYSTGGTLEFIKNLNVDAHSVEELTGYPSILGGRVKTLHPGVFGGILARRQLPEDIKQLQSYKIPEIDLVIVDLYPFTQTVAQGATEQEIIEKIDIGGISLIRAAAKNYNDVTIVASVDQYPLISELLKNQDGATSLEQRRHFAALAFGVSSHYDTAIFNYFNKEDDIDAIKVSYNNGRKLRYGENPHQNAVFYGDIDTLFEKLHGKDISYNNMLDIDSALNLIDEFTQPTFAILKHTNACGIATRANIHEAWVAALSCDPVSAFGGVLIANRAIDKATAELINKLFFEVIIAPEYEAGVLDILMSKKNRIILLRKNTDRGNRQFRSVLNGVVAQDKDLKVGGRDSELKCVTLKNATDDEIENMIFANTIVKHSKSNAIVFAKDGKLISSGIGQTSRVDALMQAIAKAKSFGFDLKGAALASDAYFPFADCVEIAHKEGVTAVIQPGGSIRDKDSIEYCDNNGMTMMFTGMRHFKH